MEISATHLSVERAQKRLRVVAADTSLGQTLSQKASDGIAESQRSHISYWAKEKDWPKEFFEAKEYFPQDSMAHLLTITKPMATLRRKWSESSMITSTTPSDQKPREEKCAPYRSPNYEILLEIQGSSYMRDHKLGVRDECKKLCEKLLQTKQPVPRDTIFRDDVFKITCDKLRGKNEARIIKDLTPLLVPSIEPFATLGAEHLDVAVESVNEGWNDCVPIIRPRPQPDYAAGFSRYAFSNDQLRRLQPFLGLPQDLSYFMGTRYMHFPFLTCEIKCGNAASDVADRQNAHSMTVALKGVVELFKLVNREQEVNRRILGFSFSHDDKQMRIFGHYPVIDEDTVTYWRYPIHDFVFMERSGLEKWTAYTFTKNLYDIWVAPHFKLICSAVDDVPIKQWKPAIPEPSHLLLSQSSGLSQFMEDQTFTQEAQGRDNQSRPMDLQPMTPDTSIQSTTKRKKQN